MRALARRCAAGYATICVNCWAIGLRDERDGRDGRDKREVLAVQRLIAANDEGRVDASYTLLSLLCIEIWCRTFLDGIRSVSVQ